MASKFHDEFFQEKDAEHDALVAAVLEDIETIAALIYPVTSNESERQISGLETEKLIAGKNGFLVGYVDVVAHLNVRYAADKYTSELPYLIIDCKPRLVDIGAATRQIKTYQNLLYCQSRGNYREDIDRYRLNTHSQKVLVTNSHPSPSAHVIAKNENIALIIYDKETGRFSLTGNATQAAAIEALDATT
jgi:hypothetical protein